ncbi:MAG: non-ribosomal peptide synthase/polyketide synthase, partial [Byssovorax sp.]
DKRREPQPLGVAGEIYVGGAGVARGYLNRPELSAERFVPDLFADRPGGRLYRTGDLARRLPNGDVEYLGRIDQQVKIRGFRIELGEIEAVLSQHPLVGESLVLAREDSPGDKRLVAYVAPSKQEAPAASMLLDLEKSGAIADKARAEMPDGSIVFLRNKSETEFLFKEIFEDECYLQHGIVLPDGATVFDVGANIGMFGVFVRQRCQGAKIFAFEPIPPIFDALRLNASLYGFDAKIHQCGLGSEPKVVTFSYYPFNTVISGQFADTEAERGVVKTFLENQVAGQAGEGAVDEVLEASLLTEQYDCELRRLSDVIRENGVERIDLLKVDVEKGELAVLGGIDDEDWAKIQQLVIEVHDIEGRLAYVRSLLEGHGFTVAVQQNKMLERTNLYDVYARRTDYQGVMSKARGPSWIGPPALSGALKQHLGQALPSHMVPSAFVLLPALPLTPNGKIDRKALPAPVAAAAAEQAYVAPRTAVEEVLIGIWSSVLRVPEVGVNDDFFSLGGHSLLATQAISRVREAFGVELSLRALFEAPTPAALGQRVEEARRGGRGVVLPPITRMLPGAERPLSFAQERLWFLDRLNPGDISYNVPVAMQLVGTLDKAALQMALSALGKRHEALRTTFGEVDGRPVQIVHELADIPLPVTSLTSLPEGERQEEARRLLSVEAAQPFDLEKGPLFRARLLVLDESAHLLMLMMHHIVSDGWSMGVLQRELSALYEAFRKGEAPALPELPIQYPDYASWQRRFLEGEVLDQQLAYWTRALSGASEALDLPADHPRPPVPSHRGARRVFGLPPAVAAGLRALAQQQGVTTFMLLLAAFDVLLHRYTGQESILVGSPVAGRGRAETEGLIGFFVNTLVLRADLDPELPFLDLLSRVRETCLGAYAHADVPFERLVQKLAPERDLSRSPLFQVMFVHQSAGDEAPTGSGRRGVSVEATTAKFDLMLTMSEGKNRLGGSIEYALDLFEAPTIDRLVTHLAALLEGILAEPRTPIGDLPLLGKGEEELLARWNATGMDFPRDALLHELVEAQVDRTPEAIALVDGTERITYREMDRRSNRLAHALRRRGVGPDVLVGVCMRRSASMVIALMAILKAGGAYVPLDPAYPTQRLAQILEDASARAVLSEEAVASVLPSHGSETILLDRDAASFQGESDARPARITSPRDLAYVLFTSGSTGRPKGVAIEHHSPVCLICWAKDVYSPADTAGVLLATSICFDLSVFELFLPLASGGKLIVAENALALPELPAAHEVTLVNTVPTAIAELMRSGGVPASVRIVCLAGEALSQSLVARVYEQPTIERVYNLYGPTEDTTYSTFTLVPRGAPVTIGRPIANGQAYVLDTRRRPMPIGVPGEIYLGGEGLARGYLGRPDLTAERFVDDPFHPGERLYRTSDVGRFRADGEIEYLGRIDHQVKVRGFRIELGEIEAVLRQHAEVKDVVVLAREDVPGQKRLVAYLTGKDGARPEDGSLRAFVASKLPDFMVPSVFVVLDKLPLTPNGKIDRKALPAPDALPEPERDVVRPRTVVEHKLAEIWAAVLRVKEVSVHDNFFASGGDSILSIQIVSRAQKAGLKITPQQIFRFPTVAGLAAVAEQLGVATVIEGPVSGPVPETPIARWWLEKNVTDAQQWNQALLFETRDPLEPRALEEALAALVEHHDALRLRVGPKVEGTRLFVATEAGPGIFRRVDLTEADEAERADVIRAIATETQRSLDLTRGPVIRSVYFDLGPSAPGRLLIAIHHLAVDGVSWRILLDDLFIAYELASKGAPIALSPRTTSIKRWAGLLAEHARSREIEAEAGYWLDEARRRVARVPVDHEGGDNLEGSARSVSAALSRELTEALLREVPAVYGTQINDVLLAALAAALRGLTGSDAVLFDLEGHGREDLFPGVDLTRTVGWFTTIYPVILDLAGERDPGQILRSVKEQLRAVPRRGLGYGLLRYLRGDEALTRKLAELPQAEIVFNYLGQVGQAVPESAPLRGARESAGASRSPRARRSHLLEVSASVAGGRLQIGVSYSEAVHEKASITAFTERFVEALRGLVEHCLSPEAGGYTDSDFHAGKLGSQVIDRLMMLSSLPEDEQHPTLASRKNIEDVYPLSPLQEGLLFHTVYAEGEGAYVSQLDWAVRGAFDVPAFERALQRVVDRYSILRTFFVWEGLARPVQVVCKKVAIRADVHDLRALGAEEKAARVRGFAADDARRDFQLDRAPLLRLTVFQLGDELYRCVFDIHHLLIDGWSMPILMRELRQLYDAFVAGRDITLPPATPYGDFIAEVERKDKGKAEAFFRGLLHGFRAPTPFGVDRAPEERGPEGHEEVQIALSAASSDAIAAFARAQGLTVNTVIQGALALLLGRYSGEDDVLFGATVSGRSAPVPGIEKMVGLFINALPVRVALPPEQAVTDFLALLQAQQSEIREFEHTPLVTVQGLSEVPRGTPLFESLLVFDNYPIEDSGPEPDKAAWTEQQERAPADKPRRRGTSMGDARVDEKSNYPLTIIASLRTVLTIKIGFDLGRFDRPVVSRLLRHLETLLEGMVRAPSASIGSLSLLRDDERKALLFGWNATDAAYPAEATLHGMFESIAAERPDATALIFDGRAITYRALNEEANRLAHHLRSLDAGRDTQVGICVERSPAMVIALLAVLKTGAAYVPLDPTYPRERLALMIEISRLGILVTQEKLAASLPVDGISVVCLDASGLLSAQPAHDPTIAVDPWDIAYVMYTSGSTGAPKGVSGTHTGAINRFAWMWKTYPFEAGEICCQKTTLSFGDSIWEIFGPLLQGVPAVLIPSDELKDIRRFVATLAEHRVSRLVLVPSLLRAMLDAHDDLGARLPRLRWWTTSGEALPAELCRRFLQALPGRVLLNLYGSTEVAADATCYVPESASAIGARVPIGKPIANVQVYLLDGRREPVPVGVTGEIFVGGVGIARGYLHRPDLTAERFLPDPFRPGPKALLFKTGDLGRYLPDGDIEYLGRADLQVKVRGFRIELGEVEGALQKHPGVRQAVVTARDYGDADRRLVAYVVPSEVAPSSGDLRSFVQDLLPEYMVPSVVVLLDALPLTPSGKVDRRALPAPEVSAAAEREVVAPRSATEEALVGIFAEVLKIPVDAVSVHDGFFELGGHSLLATQAISRIRAAFGVELPLRALFEAPTAAALGQRVEEAMRGAGSPVLPPIEREVGSSMRPLSFAQERLWFLDQLTPGDSSYNIHLALQIGGSLDIAALGRALTELCRRHEALRTTFAMAEGKPVQIIREPAEMPLPVTSLATLPEGQRPAEVRRLLAVEAARPFDLVNGPLFRARLFALTDAVHTLSLTMHHIVSDGWSMGILRREIAVLYDAFHRGEASPLAELPVQYADYAAWQRRWLEGPELDRQLAYWKDALVDLPEGLDLPADRPRPPMPSHRGARRSFAVSPAVASALGDLAQREGVTLFMLLLAAFEVLLHRYTGQADIVVGSPIANRTAASTEDLIGFFVNTLVHRAQVDDDVTFTALLARVRESCLGAYAHQDIPFERLVQELAPVRDMSRTPLFQVMFVLQNAPAEAKGTGERKIAGVNTEITTAKFDLTLNLAGGERGLAGTFEYATDLFDASTIDGLATHFQVLLAGIAQRPGATVAALPMLDEAERHTLLVTWNRTATAYPREASIQGLFEAEVDRAPDAPALRFGAATLSYRELDRRANQLAHALRRRGVTAGTPVGLYAERSVEMIVALLAILKAGGAYVPLDPEYPAARLSLLIDDAEMPLILSLGAFAADVPFPEASILRLDQEAEALGRERDERPPASPGGKQLAYLMYTSGSTGKPKGVCVPHRAVVRLVKSTHYARFASDEVFLHLAPLAFDASTFEIWGPLLNGGTLAVASPERPTPESIGEAIRAAGVTTMWLTAGLYNTIIDARPESLAPLKQLLIGGEALSVPHVEKGLRLLPGTRIINGYGPTEGTTFTCCHSIRTEDLGGSIPIGRPIANTAVYILDPARNLVPIGVPGELYIGGDGVSLGYLKRPDLTAERFVVDPFGGEPGARLYRTGDLVRYRPSGEIEYLGRIDQQVKIRGHRIEPGEIEAVLAQHPGVAEALVEPRLYGPGDKRLVAYVIPEPMPGPSAEDLRSFLRAQMPDFMVPWAFVKLEAFPLTPNGKVDRRSLPEPEVGTGATGGDAAARGPVEETLLGIFAELLKLPVESIGVHDGFFELGGHSLLATQAVSRIRGAFGVELALRSLFESPTAAGLARLIEGSLRGGEAALPPLVRIDPGKPAPLSFSQERLWFLDQLTPGDSSYNIPMAIQISASLDREALARALSALTERHEALRTVFGLVDGRPVQIVAPPADVPLPIRSLAALPEAERAAEARREAADEAARPFDLQKGPLFRARLVELGAENNLLLLTMHHIVSDGWSVGILRRELAALYEAFRRGEQAELPELPITYASFAAWQRAWLQGDVLDAQLAYWRGALAEAPEALDLPTDRPRPAVASHRGAVKTFALPPDLSEALHALARRENVTLFMLLLGAYDVLLHRYSGQDDIVVGSPFANRGVAATEGLVGFFVNTLVIRTKVAADRSFSELLAEVREACIGAYAHQDTPFERLVLELSPERSLARTPLFQVAFTLTPGAAITKQSDDRRAAAAGGDVTTAKFDLTLAMSGGPGGLGGWFEYATDLFDEATIDRLIEHFRILLGALCEAPGTPVGKVGLIGDEERATLVNTWNQTTTPYPRETGIAALFEQVADAHPDACAARFDGEELTYRALDERANRLARHLQQKGVGPETRVGLYAPRGLDMVVAMLAILKAGGAYLPLDPDFPAARLGFLIEDAKIPVIVASIPLDPEIALGSAVVVRLDTGGGAIAAEDAARLGLAIGGRSLAYVLYTSGSTGVPKGVCVEQRSIARLVRDTNYVALGPSDRIAQAASSTFDAATFEIWGALLNGGCVVGVPKDIALTPGRFAALLREERITTLFLTTALFNGIARETPSAFQTLTTLLFGGEAVDPSMVRRVLPEGPARLLHVYGPTETTTFATWHLVENVPDGAVTVPIGKALSNTTLYVLDAHRELCPIGVHGELYIGGDGVARGYLDRPELTAERFLPDPFSTDPEAKIYRTGDLVRLLPGGEIEYLSRIDQQVKIRGHRIEPGEIEALLQKHPEVTEALVMPWDFGPGDRRLVAYVVVERVPGPSADALKAYLRGELPEYMVPSAFVSMEAFPLTSSGKIDRRSLPAPEIAAAGTGERAAPRGPIEEALVGIYAELLKMPVEAIGIDDSFFELGGHSLLATLAISRIRGAFGVELPLRALFESPTPARLAQELEAALRGNEGIVLPPLVREPPGAPRPLSFSQERLWFLDKLTPGDVSYNVPLAVQIQGSLDVDALGRALTELCRRHEALRTTFASAGDQAVQVVAEPAVVPLPVVSLASWPEGERDAEARRLAAIEAARPFDLEKGPLFRATLYELGEGQHLVLLTMHHIVSDGWSMGILQREMLVLYEAFREGEASPLPELSVQYGDYAAWQRRFLRGDMLDRQLAYWKEALRGASHALDLPADHERPPVPSHRGARRGFTVSEETSKALVALARKENVTLFMLLLAAFDVLLHRLSGQTSVLVGTPVSGRGQRETENLIGFFVNTLVLRADLDGDLPFTAVLARVRESCLGAYSHADLPFERLVQALSPERDLARSPLFQVMFLLQNAGRGGGSSARRAVGVEGTTAKFDLTLTMLEGPSRLAGSFEYALDLFEAGTIERMIGYLVRLLDGIARDPAQPVGDLPLLGEAERERVLGAFNATEVAYPPGGRVHDLFEAQVDRAPSWIAVNGGSRSLRFDALDAEANRLAHRLIALGVGPDTLVGVCMSRRVELLVALLGVLKAGGAYVPLDPSYPRERLEFMIGDAQAGVLLTTSDLVHLLPASGARVIALDVEDLSAESSARPSVPVRAEDLAYVIYTSGSTGRPKGSMLEHRGVVNYLRWAIDAYRAAEGAGAPVHSSIGFDLTVTSLFVPLLAGKTVTLVPEERGVLGLADALRAGSDFSLVKLTPSHLEALSAELGEAGVAGKTRALIIGGEALFGRHLQLFREQAPETRLINEYGPTETVVGCAVYEVPPGPLPEGAIPIGRPIANSKLYLLDARQKPVATGAIGEIYIGGAQVGRGYLNQPALTAERFLADPFAPGGRMYRTGDLGRHRADGALEYLGRADTQVKIRGFRIELGEIEAVLAQHPEVREVAVLAREDIPGQKRLAAYLTAAPGAPIDEAGLRDFLGARLPDHMIPAAFVVLAEMPLTENGKIDRRALPAPAGELDEARERVLPRDEVERTLASIWTRVLRVDAVGVHDNFFAVGGDSILGIQIVSRARQAGLKITPQQIFRFPTIAGLASVAERIDAGAEVEARVEGPIPFTPIARWWLERDLVDPHHYNQSVLLEAREPLDAAMLEGAVRALVDHHDVLRVRLSHEVNGPSLTIVPDVGEGIFRRVDFDVLNDEQARSSIRAIASTTQASLNLAEGPVFRAVYFDLGPARPGRLLIVIHHLAVDGVSWRILLDDLWSAYSALARGEAIALPPRTTSVKRWATLLGELSRSPEIEAEAGYWLSEARRRALPLPVDRAGGENDGASAKSVSFALSAELTESLLRDVPAVYGTQINDVLLTAFALALRAFTKSEAVLFDLEGHGREEIVPGVDLSRTVGWFTSLYPVVIDLEGEGAPGVLLRAVKEQLRAIPRRGLGYGLLRYLRGDDEISRDLASLPQAEVIFNYLGQVGQAVPEQSRLRAAREPAGAPISPRARRSHLLEVTANVAGGRLLLQIGYSEKVHDEATATALGERFLAELRGLIEHCLAPEAGGYSPSDFQVRLPQHLIDQLARRALLPAGEAAASAAQRKNIEAIYPLSPMQEGMLFHTVYAQGDGVYVTQLDWAVRGSFDLGAFERAFQRLVERHAILRTFFVWEGLDQPVQVVEKQAPFRLGTLDLRGRDPAEQVEEMRRFGVEDRRRDFDLGAAPLLRVTVFHLGDDVYRCLFSIHHILVDGWSMPILIRELRAFYDAETTGRTLDLPALPRYADFIAWLGQQDAGKAESFFRGLLGGFRSPTPFGVDRIAPEGVEAGHEEQQIVLSEELSSAVQAFARAEQLTVSTLVQGAFALLLARYSGEDDVVFGATVSGRTAPVAGIERMVGIFINAVPVRARIDRGQPVGAFLAGLQEQQIEAREYEHTPLVAVQGMSEVPRGTPLFESILVFENYPIEESMGPAPAGEPGREVTSKGEPRRRPAAMGDARVQERSNYPLMLVSAVTNKMIFRASYDRRRFDRAAIVRMLRHLKTLLEGMVSAAAGLVGEVPILPADERETLISAWNATRMDFPSDRPVHALIEEQASRTPEARAVSDEGATFTYRELVARSRAIAGCLVSRGVGAGSLVGVALERSAEMVATLVGIWMAGAAYVPLDPAYPEDRLSFMIADAGLSLLVTEASLEEKMRAIVGSAGAEKPVSLLRIDADREAIEAAAATSLPASAGPLDRAYVIYTSGSTGRPKGVEIPHRALANFLWTMRDRPGIRAEDRLLAVTSLSFDIAGLELFLPLVSGAEVFVASRAATGDGHALKERLTRSAITMIQATPSTFRLLLEAGWAGDPSLTVLVGGEAVPRDLVNTLAGKAGRVWNMYGPTETTIWSCIERLEAGSGPVSIGGPIGNTQVYVLDPRRDLCPIAVPGELYIGGTGLALGYLKRPELTADRFVPDPFSTEPGARLYRTGDLCRRRGDGSLEFLGRLDLQVKLRGFRIELGEIESVLLELGSLKQAVVVVREDIPGDTRLVAYVVAAGDVAPSAAELRAACRSKLPEHMVPGVFVRLDRLPLTANGK